MHSATAERLLFRAATVWFLGGLLCGLWLLRIFTGGASYFAAVRNLHVSLMVPGWSGMVAAAGLLAAVRRRRGRLSSERWAMAALALWNVWALGTAATFFLPAMGLLRVLLEVLLPAAIGCVLLSVLGAPGGWVVAAATAGATGYLTVHGVPAALPSDVSFNALAAVSGAVAARFLWRRRLLWICLLWLPAIVLRTPWSDAVAAVATAVVAVVAVAAARNTERVGTVFLAFALAADAFASLLPAPTPLAAAGGLSSAGFAALYMLAPHLVRPQVSRLHATLHLPGFAALIAGLQVGLLVLAWAGALAVVAGAGYLMVTLAGPALSAEAVGEP